MKNDIAQLDKLEIRSLCGITTKKVQSQCVPVRRCAKSQYTYDLDAVNLYSASLFYPENVCLLRPIQMHSKIFLPWKQTL